MCSTFGFVVCTLSGYVFSVLLSYNIWAGAFGVGFLVQEVVGFHVLDFGDSLRWVCLCFVIGMNFVGFMGWSFFVYFRFVFV